MKRLFYIGLLLTSCSSAQGAISLVATGSGWANGPTTSTNTTPMNCTGANFLAAVPAGYAASVTGAGAISDSVGGNTWVSLTEQIGDSNRHAAVWYALNASVGSAMNISFNGGAGNTSGIALTAACYSGVAATSAFDVQNGSAPVQNLNAFKPGSVAPAIANELFLTGIHNNNGDTSPTLNSGFTLEAQSAAGGSTRSYLADFIQGAASAVDVTWTFTGSSDAAPSVIATFKPPAAAGGGGCNKFWQMEKAECGY